MAQTSHARKAMSAHRQGVCGTARRGKRGANAVHGTAYRRKAGEATSDEKKKHTQLYALQCAAGVLHIIKLRSCVGSSLTQLRDLQLAF
jgi:hypothetical protein